MNRKPVRLNIGCGIGLISGFINVDKAYSLEDLKSKKGLFEKAVIEPGSEYVQANVLALPFPDEYADYIESIDMIEHLPFRDTLKALMEMRRVLKKGGQMKVVTANFDDLAKLWVEQVVDKNIDFNDVTNPYYELMQIIYGNQQAAGEFHHTPFNPSYAYAMFLTAGFEREKIEIIVYPKGTPCDLPPLLTNGDKEAMKGWGMRTEMMVISVTK